MSRSSCGRRTCRTRVPVRTAVAPARRGRPRDLTPILGLAPTRITKPHALGCHLESDTSQVEPLALALIVIACDHVAKAPHLTPAV